MTRDTIARNKMALSAIFTLCLVLAQFGVMHLSPWAWPVRIILPATIAAAPAALWIYRGRVGVSVIFVGLAANLCVILANGGLMPMERTTLVRAIGAEGADAYTTGQWIAGSKDVLVERPDGRLLALGDQIIVRMGSGGFVASPGDFVIWSGIVILAAEASVAWQLALARRRQAERIERIQRAQEALKGEPGGTTAAGGAATQR